MHSTNTTAPELHFSFIALLLPGCFVTDMCCDATCVKTNVTGEAALHLSLHQPPVIRTLHMKAMTDITGGGRKKKPSEMED